MQGRESRLRRVRGDRQQKQPENPHQAQTWQEGVPVRGVHEALWMQEVSDSTQEKPRCCPLPTVWQTGQRKPDQDSQPELPHARIR